VELDLKNEWLVVPVMGKHSDYQVRISSHPGIKGSEMIEYQVEHKDGTAVCNGTVYTKCGVKDLPYTMFNCNDYKNGKDKYLKFVISDKKFWEGTGPKTK
jgi:hypothetical protein